MNLYGITLMGTLIGAAGMVVWRLREGRSPVTPRKILLPPLGMATGLAMFLFPATHLPLSWSILALGLGAGLLAYPLMVTSRLEKQGEQIWVRRSPTFLWILLSLVAVRWGLREVVGHFLTPLRTGALFYLLALGMVFRWRWAMWLDYQRLKADPTSAADEPVPS